MVAALEEVLVSTRDRERREHKFIKAIHVKIRQVTTERDALQQQVKEIGPNLQLARERVALRRDRGTVDDATEAVMEEYADLQSKVHECKQGHLMQCRKLDAIEQKRHETQRSLAATRTLIGELETCLELQGKEEDGGALETEANKQREEQRKSEKAEEAGGAQCQGFKETGGREDDPEVSRSSADQNHSGESSKRHRFAGDYRTHMVEMAPDNSQTPRSPAHVLAGDYRATALPQPPTKPDTPRSGGTRGSTPMSTGAPSRASAASHCSWRSYRSAPQPHHRMAGDYRVSKVPLAREKSSAGASTARCVGSAPTAVKTCSTPRPATGR